MVASVVALVFLDVGVQKLFPLFKPFKITPAFDSFI